MSENILYKFAQDLSQLYASTRIRKIEDYFIKVAQVLDTEVEKWLQKAVQTDFKSTLNKPQVLDTLIFLIQMKQKYSSGITTPEFVRAFHENKFKTFLVMILALKDIASGGNYAILSPFQSFFEAAKNINDVGNPDIGAIKQDVEKMDYQLREEINRKVNQPYEDDMISPTKKKITKKEKTGLLLEYLTRRFAEEVSIAFEQSGKLDTIGLTENNSVLRDPRKIMSVMFPNYPIGNMHLLVKTATELANAAIKIPDRQYYDHVFNEIKAKIMYISADMTPQQYNTYKYESMLNAQTVSSDEYAETNKVNVSATAWIHADTLLLLSTTLFIIGSKIR